MKALAVIQQRDFLINYWSPAPLRWTQLFVAVSLIFHANARPHIADVVTKKLSDYGWKVLPHAPYSPDMSPPDFDLFPKLKEPMHG